MLERKEVKNDKSKKKQKGINHLLPFNDVDIVVVLNFIVLAEFKTDDNG